MLANISRRMAFNNGKKPIPYGRLKITRPEKYMTIQLIKVTTYCITNP